MTTPDPKLLIASEDYTPHWIKDLPIETYHADKTSISSSSLKSALVSAAAFEHQFFKAEKKAPTAAQRFGSLFDMALFEEEKFRSSIAIDPEFQGKGSVQLQRTWDTENEKAIIITDKDLVKIDGMLKSVRSHMGAMAILERSETQISGYFKDPDTGLRCRIRPDMYSRELKVLCDLKTTIDVGTHAFRREIKKWGYPFQSVMYRFGIQIIEGIDLKHCMLLAVSKEPPYETKLYKLREKTLSHNFIQFQKALKVVLNSIETNRWNPQQPFGYEAIDEPDWVFYLEEEED